MSNKPYCQEKKKTCPMKKKEITMISNVSERKLEGTIKVRGCADLISQREYTNKTEKWKPTVSLESMMMSCAINAEEGSYVAVTDILGAFLHADMEQ